MASPFLPVLAFAVDCSWCVSEELTALTYLGVLSCLPCRAHLLGPSLGGSQLGEGAFYCRPASPTGGAHGAAQTVRLLPRRYTGLVQGTGTATPQSLLPGSPSDHQHDSVTGQC